MRQTKMVEWMENVEKAISRIMADKVYTSAEFKRERDNFHVSTTYRYTGLKAEYCEHHVGLFTGFVQRLGESRGEEMAATNPGDLDG